MLEEKLPYTRVLAMNDRGRGILKEAKKTFPFLNPGEIPDHPHWSLEKRCGDLYGLFCTEAIEAPGAEENRRLCYQKGSPV